MDSVGCKLVSKLAKRFLLELHTNFILYERGDRESIEKSQDKYYCSMETILTRRAFLISFYLCAKSVNNNQYFLKNFNHQYCIFLGWFPNVFLIGNEFCEAKVQFIEIFSPQNSVDKMIFSCH